VLKNLKKISPESVFEISDSPVTFNIAFLMVLFEVWEFFFLCFSCMVGIPVLC